MAGHGNLNIFSLLASALHWSMKSGIWQFLWLDLVGINLCAIHIHCIPNGSRVTGHVKMDGLTSRL